MLMLLPLAGQAQMPSGTLDQIVAVVNDHTILKSEVDEQVQEQMIRQQQQGNPIPFSENLWYSVLQNIVQQYVILDHAELDSVTVSDEQVDQQINQQINAYVNQLGSEAAAEQQLGQSLVELRAELRQSYREQMIVQQYMETRLDEVQITRPEVQEFFNSIPEDSLPTIPEQVALSHIVQLPPASTDARQSARQLAEQLRDSVVNHGRELEEMARRYSDGPNAENGGKLPMISIDDLVPEYSAAAAALAPGEISEVVETSFGFHVIRLNRQSGDQIDTNHILITIDEDNYNEQVAIDRLNELRDSILTNDGVNFAAVAREHSEDPNTAPNGGRLTFGQAEMRHIPLSELEPSLYRIVLLLDDPGDISEPRPFNTGTEDNTRRAYRIVRLDEHIPEHTANMEQDYERIENFARQEKEYRIRTEWIDEMKEDVYIDYKIPVPDRFR